jgi:hypothetical protein
MPGLSSSSVDLDFMLRVITGDRVGTPTMHILTGIAGSGGTAIGTIGSSEFASQSPHNLRSEISTVIS